MSELRIIVATHKPYRMPEGSCYLPLQVGAFGKPSLGPEYRRDDEGENISARNSSWCELTGLYWAWKNLRADALGLVHYRRLFRGAKGVATEAEFAALFTSRPSSSTSTLRSSEPASAMAITSFPCHIAHSHSPEGSGG